MAQFELNRVKYKYFPFKDIKKDIEAYLPQFYLFDDTGYIDMGAAFDIETTSYYSEKYKANRATMYHWQFALNDLVITGQSWDEFIQFIQILNKRAKKSRCLASGFLLL